MRKKTFEKYRKIFDILINTDFSKEFSLRQFCYEHSIGDVGRKAFIQADVLFLKSRGKNGSIYIFNLQKLSVVKLFEIFISKVESLTKIQRFPDQKLFIEYNINSGEFTIGKSIKAEISKNELIKFEKKLKDLFETIK